MQRLWQKAAYTTEIRKDCGKPHIRKGGRANTARPPRCFSLEAKFFEQKAPDHIQPADNDTGRNGYDNADNEPDKTALFDPSTPPYHNFHYPVYAGDKEENDLHKARKFVKPSHNILLEKF